MFSVLMDRHGRTKEEIIESIDRSMEDLAKADAQEDAALVEGAYSTCFTYYLENETSRTCAGIGMDDLGVTALYILLFSPSIECIELESRDGEEASSICYSKKEDGEEYGYQWMTLCERRQAGDCVAEQEHTLIFMEEDGLTLAVPADRREHRLLEIAKDAARLYIDFPLIGSERFPFPVVLNDRSLSRSSLGEAGESEQMAATLLLGWIYKSQPETVQQLFPQYSNDEGKAKLMTPAAAAKLIDEKEKMELQNEELRKDQEKYKGIMELLGTDDPNQAKEKLHKLINDSARETGGMEETEMYRMDAQYGVLVDWNEWAGRSKRDLEAFCRLVGTGGEKYALQFLKQLYCDIGYRITCEDADRICMEKDSGEECPERVELYYPDNDGYHQEGWDIRVTESAGEQDEITYLEVKTNTRNSIRRNLIALSDSQMRMATRFPENYGIVHVMWDKDRMCGVQAEIMDSVIQGIAEGKLSLMDSRYVFRLNR